MASHLRRAGVALFIAALLALYAAPAITQSFPGLITTDRLLGRDTAGTGQMEQLTVGGAIAFTGSGGITVTGTSLLSTLTAGTGIDFNSTTIDLDFTELTEGSGIDLGANSVSFDSTELNSITWGSGTFTTNVFDAGATDPTWTYGSNSVALTNAATLGFGSSTVTTGNIELNHATANTLTASGGVLSIEGVALIPDAANSVDAANINFDYVGAVADGTGIDGTATGEGSTYTPSFDATEISSATWGAGTFTAFTFNAGATDPVFTFGSNSFAITGAATFTTGGNTVWHAGNDGAASTLDADLLDGISSAGFALSTVTLTAGVGLSGGGDLTANRTFTLDTTEVNSTTWGSGTFTTLTFDAGAVDPVWTYASGIATLSTGDLRATTAGTNTASVVTVGGTQTLTAKTLTSPTITTSPTAAGSTWTDLGTVTTADINGGTLDGTIIGGASAAAITGTIITANTSVLPDANDGAVLGASGTAWADLFLADGGTIVIGATGSSATLTHTAASDSLTIAADPDNATASSVINLATDGANEAILNSTNLTPGANDGNALGSDTVRWADLFVADGGVLNLGASGSRATITHTAASDSITIAADPDNATATSQVIASVDGTNELILDPTNLTPGADGGNSLGTTALGWQNLFRNTGFVDNWEGGDCLLTHSSNSLALTGSCVLTSDSSLDLSGITTATLTASGANLLVEGSIVRKVGRATEAVYASQWNPTITNGAARSYVELATNDIISDTLQFSTATQQFATFYWVPPNAWNAGTVTFRARWRSTIGTSSDTLVMELACVAVSNDDALDAAPGTGQTSTDTWLANGDEHVSPESSAITCAGTPAKGDTIQFKLQRNVASDDVDDAFVEAVEIFYTTDAANDS